MNKLVAIAFTALLIVACGRPVADTQTDRLYKTLDSLIERHDEIVAAKESQIMSLSKGLQGVTLTPEQEYEKNLRLYDEYLAFRFDSAFYYINRNIQSPLATTDAERRAASAIRLAHILSVSGIFNNARLLLDSIQPDLLSTETRVLYYNQRAELNLYRSEMAQYTPYFMNYIDSAQYYRQMLLQIAPKESFEYIVSRASYVCEQGDVEGAIRLFEEYLPTLQSGDRRYSIVASTLAYFYWKNKKHLTPLEQRQAIRKLRDVYDTFSYTRLPLSTVLKPRFMMLPTFGIFYLQLKTVFTLKLINVCP